MGDESYDYELTYHYDPAGNILPQETNPYYQDFKENRVQEDAAYFYFYDQYGNLDRKNHKEKMSGITGIAWIVPLLIRQFYQSRQKRS